jgi:hypothetical protein
MFGEKLCARPPKLPNSKAENSTIEQKPAEPVFVNVCGAKKSTPPAYVAWRTGTTNRIVVPAHQAGNRFLGSSKGLQIRTLLSGLLAGAFSLCWNFRTIYGSQEPSRNRFVVPVREAGGIDFWESIPGLLTS